MFWLRYKYLLCILIYFINISFCSYSYLSEDYLDKRPVSAKLKGLRHARRKYANKGRNRIDYDVPYRSVTLPQEKAGFEISESEETEPVSDNVPRYLQDKNIRYRKNYDNDKLINANIDRYEDRDAELENSQDSSQRSHFDFAWADKMLNDKLKHGFNLDSLKNLKIPFFSHSRSDGDNIKKDKNLKPASEIHSPRKENIVSKTLTSSTTTNLPNLPNLAKQNSRVISNQNDNNNIPEYSLFERLCPVCKRELARKGLDQEYEIRDINDDSYERVD